MITVRPATIKDLDTVADLFDQYRIFYKQASDIPKAKEFLKERMEGNESVILLAFANDEAVGFTQLYPIFSSVSMRRAWLLNDLFVKTSARKTGVGNKLLNAAKDFGAKTNAKWLILETSEDNFTAQSVYEGNGWQKSSSFFYQFNL
ncbi:GNAT family N-acetyltransferase [Pinibacter aurantiacus]|uniref:GNAT family N-acetyltransferase n=1 Tax=Pinibacter aurantiacus TaxID=2851599 RepID=A0A9E2W3G1_9BACT|nr:GNAT family N-acetyltransferase [Pinibacter aurantiacus]MBV4356208.1 GNAT family N-acetyltransferase [Pinibacter aurantiacus]